MMPSPNWGSNRNCLAPSLRLQNVHICLDCAPLIQELLGTIPGDASCVFNHLLHTCISVGGAFKPGAKVGRCRTVGASMWHLGAWFLGPW